MAVFSSESNSNVALSSVPLTNKKISSKRTKKRNSGWEEAAGEILYEEGLSNSVSESEDGHGSSENDLNDRLLKQNSIEDHYQQIALKYGKSNAPQHGQGVMASLELEKIDTETLNRNLAQNYLNNLIDNIEKEC